MKFKKLSAVTLALSMLSVTTTIVANAELVDENVIVSDGLKFTELEDGNLSVTGLADETLTEIAIPAEVDGKEVTEIGMGAFNGYTNITSVTISDNIVKIGDTAFLNCTSLANIEIPDNVTSIDFGAFTNCTSLESVIIPNKLTFIYISAFQGCTNLKSIIIPESVAWIGYYAFEGCTSLSDVYYKGTEEQWKEIYVSSPKGNDSFSDGYDKAVFGDATIHYNYGAKAPDDSDDSTSSGDESNSDNESSGGDNENSDNENSGNETNSGEEKETEDGNVDTGFGGLAATIGIITLAGAAVVVSRKIK